MNFLGRHSVLSSYLLSCLKHYRLSLNTIYFALSLKKTRLWCNFRKDWRVGLSNFPGKNKDQPPLDKAMEFDPIRQHRHFCPWIASTGNSAPGWQQVLSALQRQNEFLCPLSTKAPSSSLIEVIQKISYYIGKELTIFRFVLINTSNLFFCGEQLVWSRDGLEMDEIRPPMIPNYQSCMVAMLIT